MSHFNFLLLAVYCRDLLPIPPSPGDVPSCAEGGVLGVLPGVIGCIQVRMKEGHGKRGLIYTVKYAATIFNLKIAAAHFSYHLILCPAIWAYK